MYKWNAAVITDSRQQFHNEHFSPTALVIYNHRSILTSLNSNYSRCWINTKRTRIFKLANVKFINHWHLSSFSVCLRVRKWNQCCDTFGQLSWTAPPAGPIISPLVHPSFMNQTGFHFSKSPRDLIPILNFPARVCGGSTSGMRPSSCRDLDGQSVVPAKCFGWIEEFSIIVLNRDYRDWLQLFVIYPQLHKNRNFGLKLFEYSWSFLCLPPNTSASPTVASPRLTHGWN